jgi:hypothetical protein
MRGLSSALSAASSACDHIRDWVLGTPEGTWVSMGVISDGSYGQPEGIVYSFPCTCSGGEWSIVQVRAWGAAWGAAICRCRGRSRAAAVLLQAAPAALSPRAAPPAALSPALNLHPLHLPRPPGPAHRRRLC